MCAKYLGKIESVSLGIGGYQAAMFGLSVSLSFDGSHGCGDFRGTWCPGVVDVRPGTKWTEAERSHMHDTLVRFIAKLLVDAKKKDLYQLKGVPVEVEMDGMSLKSWRVLTEVL